MLLRPKDTNHAGSKEIVMILKSKDQNNLVAGPIPFQISRRHARCRGFVLAWVSVVIFVLFLLVGLSLDIAKLCLVSHQLHNAADAGALAGANVVKKDRDLARIRARDTAGANWAEHTPVALSLNEYNDPDGDIVIGWYNRGAKTFIPVVVESDPANAVAVIAPRTAARSEPVSLNFGTLVNVPTADLVARWQEWKGPYAIAMCAGGTGAGLIALKDTEEWEDPDPGLTIQGNVILDVIAIDPANPSDGEVQINSPLDNAFQIQGTAADVLASAINVTGELDIRNYDLTVPFNTPAPPIPDPLAWLEPPYQVSSGTQDNSSNDIPSLYTSDLSAATKAMVGDKDTGQETRIDITTRNYDESGNPIPWELYPGYYPDGFYINCAGTLDNPAVHFNPGVYIIGGETGPFKSGLIVTSLSYVVSDQATFFITSNADASEYGVVEIQAGAGFKATEPTGGYYEGVTIFQDRANENLASIGGSGNLDLDGTLYFPNAEVYLRGGGNGFGNQLIGWKFDIGGDGEVGIQYDGRNRAPVTTSFLVE